MRTYQKIKVANEDGVAVVTLSDPAKMNAASLDMVIDLTNAFLSLKADKSVGAILLTGEGRGFCSGADLSPRPELEAEDRDLGSSLDTHYNPMMKIVRELDMPIITAVNGAAAGVGCSLALAGDLIVAAESAYFLQAFRRIGLVPDGGSTYMLPRMIGKARAMEMVLLGERVPARTALEWGLINRCVPDAELMPTAMALAKELAHGPWALGAIRKLMWAAQDASFSEQLDAERAAQQVAGKTWDFSEGVAAFQQKRPAAFERR